MAAFTHAGAHPSIGAHLAQIFTEAGVGHVTSIGIQGYLAPDDPTAARLLAGVVRSLHDTIVGAGIAEPAEIGLDTLEERLAAEARDATAVLMPPTVACAWGLRL